MTTFGINDFVRRQTPESRFSHFDGTWDELRDKIAAAYQLGAWEKGYRDGVILVGLAPDRFFSGVVTVTSDTKLRSFPTTRRPDEDLYVETVASTQSPKLPARFVEAVCYRKDLLLADGDPVSGADWDLISINAKTDPDEPVHPVTMARNFLERPGGTKAEYTARQFAEAVLFWQSHVLRDDGPLPQSIDVEQRYVEPGIVLLGTATRQPDGKYHCLANVGGMLCKVEVNVTAKESAS